MTTNTAPARVLVTGCSTGIGLETALGLARAGYRVTAAVKSPADHGDLPRLAAGLPIDLVEMDITDVAGVERVFADLERTGEPLHALVNNAGIGIGGFLEDLADDEIRSVFETNVFGTTRVIRRALPLLRRRTPSYVLTLSSLSGRIGTAGMTAYNSSKFALEGLLECLYYELLPQGIRVVVVEPGLVKTGLIGVGFRPARAVSEGRAHDPARVGRLWADLERRVQTKSIPAAKVAEAIEKILRTASPPLRVPVGPDARVILLLRRILPEGLFHRMWARLAEPR